MSHGAEPRRVHTQAIENSLAVEFDTYHNFELMEPYENHISVQTRGWRQPNSANHRSGRRVSPSSWLGPVGSHLAVDLRVLVCDAASPWPRKCGSPTLRTAGLTWQEYDTIPSSTSRR
jgi:hypothetical protein